MNKVWRERRALSHLSDEQLRDIGVHPATAKREYERSYFDLPDGRIMRYESTQPNRGRRTR